MADQQLKRAGALSELISGAVKNLKLEEKPSASSVGVIEVEPAKTRMNDLHRRSHQTTSGAAIEEMVTLFKATGQLSPAKGWKLERPEEDGTEIVLVYGARRRAAALSLGCPLKVELLPSPPDRGTVIRLMHGENRGRLDYLPLEDAREYRAFLDSGEYRTAEEMAASLGQDKGKVSRLLSLLKLPEEVLALYTDPAWLPLQLGAKLASLCGTDKRAKARVLAACAEWQKQGRAGNPTTTLMRAAEDRKASTNGFELKAGNGRAFGTVRGNLQGEGPVSVVLAKTAPEELRKALAGLLSQYGGS